MEAEIRALNQHLEQRVARAHGCFGRWSTGNSNPSPIPFPTICGRRLRAIDGFSRMLEEDCADRLGEEGRRYGRHDRPQRATHGTAHQRHPGLLAGRRGCEIAAAAVDMTALAQEIFEEVRSGFPAERNIVLQMGTLLPAQATGPCFAKF